MPVTQTISFSATPPTTGETPTVFNYNAIACWNELKNTTVPNLNTAFTQMNALESNVNAKEASAVAASAAAVMAANFQGTWTNQTTTVGQSWEYLGVIYGVLIAGNTSPVATPSNWIALTTAQAIKNVPSGDISATTVQSAINELDTEKAPKDSPTFTGSVTIPTLNVTTINAASSIVFEGSIANDFETTLQVTEPTADRTITVPDSSGTIALLESPELTGTPTAPTAPAGTNTTQLATTAYVDRKMTLATAVASTSGTAIDFVGIPSWAKRITVMFSGVSTNGTSVIRIQLGSGTIQTTGYISTYAVLQNGVSPTVGQSTAGFDISSGTAAADFIRGKYTFETMGNNIWESDGHISRNGGIVQLWNSAGDVALPSTLTTIRIATVNGTDTFDAGSINILYEG